MIPKNFNWDGNMHEELISGIFNDLYARIKYLPNHNSAIIKILEGDNCLFQVSVTGSDVVKIQTAEFILLGFLSKKEYLSNLSWISREDYQLIDYWIQRQKTKDPIFEQQLKIKGIQLLEFLKENKIEFKNFADLADYVFGYGIKLYLASRENWLLGFYLSENDFQALINDFNSDFTQI